MDLDKRTQLIPVDTDWTMDMCDDIARYILETKEKTEIDGMMAPIMGVHIVALVAKHMSKNGYALEFHGND